jgi:hypothetical protein
VGALPNGQGHRRAADQRVARGHPEEPGVPVSPLTIIIILIIIIIIIYLFLDFFIIIFLIIIMHYYYYSALCIIIILTWRAITDCAQL